MTTKRNEKNAVVDSVYPLLMQIATTGLISDRLKAIELMLSHADDTERNDVIAVSEPETFADLEAFIDHQTRKPGLRKRKPAPVMEE